MLKREHIIPAAVAGVISVIAVIGGHLVEPTRQLVVTQTNKPHPNAWGELTQQEVDKLTAILKKVPKSEVGIFCSNADCENLALDFDNAFESAGWKSGIERPIMDSNTGIHVGPPNDKGKELSTAIYMATNGRIKPDMLEAQIIGENRLVLVISKKKG